MEVTRFQVYLTRMDPAMGREMKKTRPAVVVSPDEMNASLGTVVIAPMTTKGMPAPFRIISRFRGREGRIAVDQVKAIDKRRLGPLLGTLDATVAAEVSSALVRMFS